ncbi:MAG: hypothetical protein WCC57_05110 [Paracoccaceae bacterium]
MKKSLVIALTLVLAVTACGRIRDSKLNPFNWFGRSQQVQTAAVVLPGADEDPRPLVEQVLSMSVEPMQGGAIVRATGLSPNQGWWDGELVAREIDENGVLIYDFRLVPPLEQTAVSTQRSREVTVAARVSNRKLESITQIVVQGATNARSSRR